MEHDTKLNKARIAAREGISRARVTQVMNLLQLPAEIQASLLRPPAPLEIHSFSERRLRVLLSCGEEETQTSRWRQLVQELKVSAGHRTKIWLFWRDFSSVGKGLPTGKSCFTWLINIERSRAS
jgi:hypothetical protein